VLGRKAKAHALLMDDSDELARLRAELVETLTAGWDEIIRRRSETLASPPGSAIPRPLTGPEYEAFMAKERALRALRPPASDAEFREFLPVVLECFPDAVEVTPAFLIEWDLRGEPPEAWVNDAIDRRAQLYSPAERAFLLVQQCGSVELLTAERYDEERRNPPPFSRPRPPFI
jgi:hypothetical protein